MGGYSGEVFRVFRRYSGVFRGIQARYSGYSGGIQGIQATHFGVSSGELRRHLSSELFDPWFDHDGEDDTLNN